MRLTAEFVSEARWYHGVIRPYRKIRTFFVWREKSDKGEG